MTVAQIINEIEHLDTEGRGQVIDYALECARQRQMCAEELSSLASTLSDADPAEAASLRQKLEQGFYGGGGFA